MKSEINWAKRDSEKKLNEVDADGERWDETI